MDDFVISNLQESKNEWCSRLVSIFSPLIIEGIKSIFNESLKMCIDNDEPSKYLMTFQNLLERVPKWNLVIVEGERKRIVERSGCNYLEDLISCVHIIQLKVLTCIRVGNKQKQIDISIPKLDNFIHKVYIHVARKVYMNVYLFDKQVTPLQSQKNGRELEIIVQECILTTIRESIPTEDIIRAYMDESVEHEEEITIEKINDVEESPEIDEKSSEINEEPVKNPEIIPVAPVEVGIKDIDKEEITTRLKFNDYDSVLDEINGVESISAPKSIERLEEISVSNALQRKLEAEMEDDEDKIKISEDSVDLGILDFLDIDKGDDLSKDVDIPLLDVEELV
jgi:hypothetical protein